MKTPAAERLGVERLHHQDAVADGQRTRAAGVADCHVCCAARANRRAVYDQRIGARGGAALVEHRVELQRAAIGDESAGAGETPAWRAPVITSTSPATGLLCRSMMPELVNVVTPIKWPCNGPPSAIALLGFPSGRYCPVLSSVVAPVTAGSAQRSVVGEAVVWAGRRGPLWPPEAYRARRPHWCRRSASGRTVPLLVMLLSPPVNCTKPVMVPLLMMLAFAGNRRRPRGRTMRRCCRHWSGSRCRRSSPG